MATSITPGPAEDQKTQWHEQDGVIDFSVTSDGTTGPEWIDLYPGVGEYTKSVLRSPDFRPTKKGTIMEIVVLKSIFWNDNERITKNIRAAAYAGTFTQGRKLFDPNADVACLAHKKFSYKDIEAMGLWGIVVMHHPINDCDEDPSLLFVRSRGVGLYLEAGYVRPESRWGREYGFAFAVSPA